MGRSFLVLVLLGSGAAYSTTSPFEEKSGFFSTLDLSHSRLNSVDRATRGAALFVSKLNQGLSFGWMENWTSRWSTEASLRMVNIHFNAPTQQSLVGSKNSFGSGKIFTDYRPLSWLRGGLGFIYANEIFLRAVSLNVHQIEHLSVPQLALRLQADIYQRNAFGMTTSLVLGAMKKTRSTQYEMDGMGTSLEGRVSATQNFSDMALMSSVFFQQRNYKSTIAEHSRLDIGVLVGFKIYSE